MALSLMFSDAKLQIEEYKTDIGILLIKFAEKAEVKPYTKLVPPLPKKLAIDSVTPNFSSASTSVNIPITNGIISYGALNKVLPTTTGFSRVHKKYIKDKVSNTPKEIKAIKYIGSEI